MRDIHIPPSSLQQPQQPQQSSLADLPVGIDAIVVNLLDTPEQQRCAELGFFRGAHVQVLISGDPSLVSLNDARVAISRKYLANVNVSYFQ